MIQRLEQVAHDALLFVYNVTLVLPNISPRDAVVLLQIGVAVTIIALGQYAIARRNSVKDSAQPPPQQPRTPRELRHLREAIELTRYLKLLTIITGSGTLYFAAAPIVIVATAFFSRLNEPESRFLTNLVLVFVFVPFLLNAVCYMWYVVLRRPLS